MVSKPLNYYYLYMLTYKNKFIPIASVIKYFNIVQKNKKKDTFRL